MALIRKVSSRRLNWSELPSDVMRSVLERLSYPDFHRASAVCSAWYSVWRECVAKPNQVPWLILFPDPAQTKRRCMLYNPQEEKTVYKIHQDLVVDPCLASYGTWLLMSDPRLNLYLVNALTAEVSGFPTGKAVVWIDEKTRDYVVAWTWGEKRYTASCKRRDRAWRQILPFWGCRDMVLKDHKLYMYCDDDYIRVSDLSGKFPTKAARLHMLPPFRFRLGVLGPPPHRGVYLPDFIDWTTNIVVTTSGQVLMVGSVLKCDLTWHFRIYKFNSANNDWEPTVSLGNQALILDLGTTVQASLDIQGITRNSIYFSGIHPSQKDVFIFNLSSQRIQRLSASSISSDARWLFPTP
ncbi:unnamed protein product [Brassica oleracea var. botrytis]